MGKANNGGRILFYSTKPRRWGIRRGNGGCSLRLSVRVNDVYLFIFVFAFRLLGPWQKVNGVG
jgi:hypothetical protein